MNQPVGIESTTTNGSDETDQTAPQSETSRGRSKNLVKWIQEEFEDKNLDKVKRTLLVTLDDISKGYSECFPTTPIVT